ncbi:Prefoldin [Lenzites betulinus]|nr:Prefoldin [Lenzites betulinus]
MAALHARLHAAPADYKSIQAELSADVDARQKLDAQLSENELEFASLSADNTVYKLLGPVLVQQGQSEAKQNVDGTRLTFIRSKINRVEGKLKDLGDKSDKKKHELVEMQAAIQQGAAAAAA